MLCSTPAAQPAVCRFLPRVVAETIRTIQPVTINAFPPQHIIHVTHQETVNLTLAVPTRTKMINTVAIRVPTHPLRTFIINVTHQENVNGTLPEVRSTKMILHVATCVVVVVVLVLSHCQHGFFLLSSRLLCCSASRSYTSNYTRVLLTTPMQHSKRHPLERSN